MMWGEFLMVILVSVVSVGWLGLHYYICVATESKNVHNIGLMHSKQPCIML